MAKTYMLANNDEADERKTITITEDVTETREKRTTVEQMKQEHAQIVEEIDRLSKRADSIVDELTEIDNNLNEITIEDKPSKITSEESKK